MPISLLNFPSDLLRDVFKECDPFDLYKLSQCSNRTRKSIMTNTELFVYLLNTFRIKTVEEIANITQDLSSGSFDGYLELVKIVIDRNMDVEVFNLSLIRDEREAVNFME
ncbi:hypothetical protein L3Y34_016204 [Caenorhabditis briggsae]|uniref:F-box domain-containing protein n=1 Tax=Caenorhabditis briggsae TaxID=6238 RepID=A0AAE9J0S5_CAEBR|nr:hypothetical protein L3Y34_016204 [Caenorhabditis briggsae]